MPPKSSPHYASQPSFDDHLKQMVEQMNKRRSRNSHDYGDNVFDDEEEVNELEKKFWRDSIASHEPSWRLGLDDYISMA